MSSLAVATLQQQLAAIRDEWLAPLIAENGTLRERVGRLEAERDHLQRRLAELEMAVHTTADTASDASAGAVINSSVAQPDPPRRRRWWPWGRG